MVDYIGVADIRRIVNALGPAAFIARLAGEIAADFRRWPEFEKSARLASHSPVGQNELMADNTSTSADPQGEYDDWIELRNLTDQPVSLAGQYLSDEPNNPRKWQFPAGTSIPANGYLIVWADEDSTVTPDLHASFKLSRSGEQIYYTDTDAHNNANLDTISFGSQMTDQSYGRTAADADVRQIMIPTPGAANP